MTGTERLKKYLDENQVEYEVRKNEVAYTAQQLADLEHVPGGSFAKVVMAFADREMVMLVLPAPLHVSATRLGAALERRDARIAHEEDFASRFPDCEPGAMPPFGNLYGIPVFVDPSLAASATVFFLAGSHDRTISLAYADFERLVQPVRCDFAVASDVQQPVSTSGSVMPRRWRRGEGIASDGDGTRLRLTTLGVGAAESPRYRPAGLLLELGRWRVMLDGGPGSEPDGPLDAWLVTDIRCELIASIRHLARELALTPLMGDHQAGRLRLHWRPVVHTNHPAGGYLITLPGRVVVWAPEFLEFPAWAERADLMFADAAGWNRPIRFARGTGGHLDALSVAAQAHAHGVRRLVFAHISRPTIEAIDRGERPPFGEFASDGQVFGL